MSWIEGFAWGFVLAMHLFWHFTDYFDRRCDAMQQQLDKELEDMEP
jgi:hypothetical protein